MTRKNIYLRLYNKSTYTGFTYAYAESVCKDVANKETDYINEQNWVILIIKNDQQNQDACVAPLTFGDSSSIDTSVALSLSRRLEESSSSSMSARATYNGSIELYNGSGC
jgi:hypothetical protein